MGYWRTTGSSSAAIKTGSTEICDNMRDITIPRAIFLPGQDCRKCQPVTVTSMTTGNSDMTDKTRNSYTTGTTTNSVEITTASQVFLTTVSSNKVSPSDCDNVRQPEMACITAAETGNTYISWTMTGSVTVPTANMGFSPRPARKKTDPERLRQRPTTGNKNIDVSGPSCNFW